MIMVTLIVTTSNYALKKQLIEPLQDAASQTMFSISGNEEGDQGPDDHKPPKCSFINYDSFFADTGVVPAYIPVVADLIFYEAFQAPPDVYQDIFVPPQNLA